MHGTNTHTQKKDVSYKILPHGGAFVYEVFKSVTVFHNVARD